MTSNPSTDASTLSRSTNRHTSESAGWDENTMVCSGYQRGLGIPGIMLNGSTQDVFK
jgi:hypothetical protein